MKRSLLLLICICPLVLGGCATTMERLDTLEASAQKLMGFDEDALQSAAMTEGSQTGEEITRDTAQRIALEHAGLTARQVTGLRTKFDTEDGRAAYEVEFRYDGWEYHYEIGGETGEILSYEKER